MAAYLSPVFGAGAQLFNNQGIVLSGGKIYTFLAGTTTPLATWTDSTQAVSNTNPIISDSAGRLSNEMWLQAGSLYKLVLTDASDNTLGTWDNIAGLNDITTSVTVSEWKATDLTPVYISSTSFSVAGNNTAIFQVNRRVQISVTAGTIYGYVVSSVFSTVTTVVIQPDSTALDSGISAVNVGILGSLHPSVPQQYPAMNAPVTVASATTTAIGAANSANVIISGVVTITAFDTVLAGIIRLVKFTGILTLTHNGTSLILPGAVNITTGVGDQAILRSLGSGNWECISYLAAAFPSVPVVGNLYSVTCTEDTGALTCGLDANIIRYRSTTLTDGQPTTVLQTGLVSLVVPSGATLGCVTTLSAQLILVAINNAGETELAIVNIAGGKNLDETTLISTTAIDTGSDSATVFYSTSARTDVAFKVVGYVVAVNTAGVWSAPTLVQGVGGEALAAMNSLGYGQTWQGVTRTSGTTYYNTTAKPIFLVVIPNGSSSSGTITVAGIAVGLWTNQGNVTIWAQYALIPPGQSYYVTVNAGTISASELR